jgi:amino acid transporter
MVEKIKQIVLGKPKNPLDPHVFEAMALAAFFAWVGVGADGLSSSCYGPEEAFISLGQHAHLAVFLAFAVIATVFILSASYSQIIELFPSGGGGYLVASKLLGPTSGVVSGCALLVDYILTISISLASGMDAIFSFLPPQWFHWKFLATVAIVIVMIVLNLRGVKESVVILTPIFLAFVVTHIFIVLYGIFTHGAGLPTLVSDTLHETHTGIQTLGWGAMLLIFFRAFSLGGGTFTGIEAVSNSMQILAEPRVATAKKTMLYMSVSLSFMAGGLLINYLLNGVHAVPGKTMNAVLMDGLFGTGRAGHWFLLFSLLAEGALLFVASQTGFVGGPRVMSTMALDGWLPRRFTNLSERLVMEDGVLVMGLFALLTILYTHASVRILVVMYSINVFVTFTLSQLGMVFHWVKNRGRGWVHGLIINGTGTILTVGILIMTSVIKFSEGGWVTIVFTGAFIVVCVLIKRHYVQTFKALRGLDEILTQLPLPDITQMPRVSEKDPTAILMVGSYNGMGIHSFLAIQRFFPGHFKNYVFVSVGVIDSDRFKGADEIGALKLSVEKDLKKYVELANKTGFYAEARFGLGTDVIEELVVLCNQVAKEWDKKVYFTGQLAFEGETFWTRILHNQTSFALQRRLLFDGHEVVILPIRLRLDGS